MKRKRNKMTRMLNSQLLRAMYLFQPLNNPGPKLPAKKVVLRKDHLPPNAARKAKPRKSPLNTKTKMKKTASQPSNLSEQLLV